jgi:Tfp pilus assembly protein PilF
MPASSPQLVRLVQSVDQAMRQGDIAAAGHYASEAAKLGDVRYQVLVLAVFDRLEWDEPEAALRYAERAMAQNRHDGEVLNAYGAALGACRKYQEALKAFDAALRQTPGRASFHYNKGCVLDDMGNNNHARMCFERAVSLQPNYPQALGHLAYLEIQRGEAEAARRYGARALKLKADEPAATLALAGVDLMEKRYADALERVRPMTGGKLEIDTAIAQGLSADALDGLGRRAEAFRAYAACNATMREIHRPIYEAPGRESAYAAARRLATYFRAAPTEKWRGARSELAASEIHVFLVGFPRSGTTLLEQALASHPDVESMDERVCLIDAENEFMNSDAGLDRLAALSDAELEPWRQRYWQRVAELHGKPQKAVFVDKLPLNLIDLPLVAKLFPEAKILLARRDPADVVWSCFRRRFGMNQEMYELLSLDGAARYYDAVMTLADLYRKKLASAFHETIYEKTVGDFVAEIEKICSFLGIAWNAAMADFAAGSRERAPNTPSGVQVAQGLYSHAVGQWTAYREELEPVLPILKPWRMRFGYDQEKR